MKRRSFIQSLLAVPVIAAVAKFVPTTAATQPTANPGPLKIRRLPKWDWRTGRFRDPIQFTRTYRAVTDLEAQMLVGHSPQGLVPLSSKLFKKNKQRFAGVTLTAVKQGEMVRLIESGEASVKLTVLG